MVDAAVVVMGDEAEEVATINKEDGGSSQGGGNNDDEEEEEEEGLVVSPHRKDDSPEVAKLQELVRKLERQNEQLRRTRRTGARRRQMSVDHQQLLEFQQLQLLHQQQGDDEGLQGAREPAEITAALLGPPFCGSTTDFQRASPALPVSSEPHSATSSNLQPAVPDGGSGRHQHRHHQHQHRHHRRHRQQQQQQLQQQQHQFGPSDHCPVSSTAQVASDVHLSSDLHPISLDVHVPSGRQISPNMMHTIMPSDLHVSADHPIVSDRFTSTEPHPMTSHLHVSSDHHPIPPDRHVSSDIQGASERPVHAVSSELPPTSPDLQPPSSGPVEETLVDPGESPDGSLNGVSLIDLEECERWEDDSWLYAHCDRGSNSEQETPNWLEWCRRFLDNPSLEMEAACRSLTSRLNSTMSGGRSRARQVRVCDRRYAAMDCGGESPKGANLTFPLSVPQPGRCWRAAAVNDCGSNHLTQQYSSPLNTFRSPEIKDPKGSDSETPLKMTDLMNGTRLLDGDDSSMDSCPSNISEHRLMVWLKEQKLQQKECGPSDNEISLPIYSPDILKDCIQVCDFDTTCARNLGATLLTETATDLSSSSVFLQSGVTTDPRTGDPCASPSLPCERQDGDGSSVSGPVDSPGRLLARPLQDFTASSDQEEEEANTCSPLSPCTDDVDSSRGSRRESPSDHHLGKASRLQTPLRLRAPQALRTDGLQQQRSKQLVAEPGRMASGLSQPQAVARGTAASLGGSQQRRGDVASVSQAKGLATAPAASTGFSLVTGSGQSVRLASANAGRAAETRARAVATGKQPALRTRAASGPTTTARSRLAMAQKGKGGSLKPGQSNASPNGTHVSMPNLNSAIVRPVLAAVKNSLSFDSNLQDPVPDASPHCKHKTDSSMARLRLPMSTSQSSLPFKTTPPPVASGVSYRTSSQSSSPGTTQGGASGVIIAHKGPSPDTPKPRSRLVAPSGSPSGASASDRVGGARAARASSMCKSGLSKPAGSKTSPNSQPCSAVPRSKLAPPTQRPLQIQRSFGALKDSSCRVNY